MFNSNQDFRNLMEEIEAIEEEFDGVEEHSEECHHDSATDMIKCIIGCLKSISERVINGNVDDESTLLSDLQHVHDSLVEIAGEEKHSEDEHEEKVEEDCGEDVTVKMAPSINSKGVQDYSDPSGDSYPARNGFTGL